MPKQQNQAEAADNQGQSGTDQFPTYQDEKALKAADAGAGKDVQSSDDPNKDPLKPVALAHGEESPAAKAEREAAEKADAQASLGLPAQMLPENQDETVK